MKLREMTLTIEHLGAEYIGLETYRDLHVHNHERVSELKQRRPDLGTRAGMLLVTAYMRVMEMARLLGKMSTMVFNTGTTFEQIIQIKGDIAAARNAAYEKYVEVGRIIREAQ